MFTCADERHDLVGELITHAVVLGSEFVLTPFKNPFHMATCLGNEDTTAATSGSGGANLTSSDYYSGNQFMYAVRGRVSKSSYSTELEEIFSEMPSKLRKVVEAIRTDSSEWGE